MSKKSDLKFKTSPAIYLAWIEEKYGITQKDIEMEFLNTKVRGNSVLTDKEAVMVARKLGLFGRAYTPLTVIASEMNVSKSKVSLMLKEIYLKISIKKQTNQINVTR